MESGGKPEDGPSRVPGSGSGPGGQPGGERWRLVSGRQLKSNTVTFPAQKQTKLSEYVKSLECSGVAPKDILSIQVSTTGECRLTLASSKILDHVVNNGFSLGGHVLRPCPVSVKTIELHVHDLPIWVTDGALETALTKYGSIVGPVRHGKFQIDNGEYIATGVRFLTFRPNNSSTTVPSYLRATDSNVLFRVYYTGQPQTCRVCNSTGHLAKNCPEKEKPPANQTPRTRRWEQDSAEQAKANHAQAPVGVAETQDSEGLRSTDVVTSACAPSAAVRDSENEHESLDYAEPPSVSSTDAQPRSPPTDSETDTNTKNTSSNESTITDSIASETETVRSGSVQSANLSFTPARRSRPSPDSSPETVIAKGAKQVKPPMKKQPKKPPPASVPGSRFSALCTT